MVTKTTEHDDFVEDREHQPVPLKARRSTFSVAMVRLVFPMSITGAMTFEGDPGPRDLRARRRRAAALRNAKLAHKTHSTLNADNSNAIVNPTWYSELAVGGSMGAQQTNPWGYLYPDTPDRIAPFCGWAKTAPHNIVFREGVKAALTNDAAWNHGGYETPPTKGLRDVGRVYAGWGLSQPFYMRELWRGLGDSSLEVFLVAFWEGFFLTKAAMDLYYSDADNAVEVSPVTSAVGTPIPGVWGHFDGGGANPVGTKFIDDRLKELLAF